MRPVDITFYRYYMFSKCLSDYNEHIGNINDILTESKLLNEYSRKDRGLEIKFNVFQVYLSQYIYDKVLKLKDAKSAEEKMLYLHSRYNILKHFRDKIGDELSDVDVKKLEMNDKTFKRMYDKVKKFIK